MKIGIDARMYSSNFTGIGRYNYELINRLAKIDTTNEYRIFLNKPEYDTFKEPGPNFKKVLAGAKHYSLSEQLKFLWVLYREKLDVMHFTHFNNPIFYLRTQVVTIHDMTLSYFPGKKMTGLIHRAAYNLSIWAVTRKAKRIIAISENTKKDLQKLLKVPDKKLSVVYEGAALDFKKITDTKELAATRATYKLKNPFILYAGVWRSHKNVLGLIKAYHHLVTEKEVEFDLVITGKKNTVYHEIPELVKKLKLEKRVHFVGLVPERDLVHLFNLATIYVFPSFYEGFGLPALEAFAVGTPVASSNTSCLPEICGENNAIFFDPYDPKDMADKILHLYNDKDLQATLIKNGTTRLKDFSWDKMAKETLEEYQRASHG